VALAIFFWFWDEEEGRLTLIPLPPEVGDELDSYRDVEIHYNGKDFKTSHGSRYSKDGYYYGKSWQCVEFAKRFYFEAKGHRMPDVWGHARDFFNPEVPHGALNPQRGLVQFVNGGTEAPQVDDLVVFRGGSFGHVAIVSEVGDDYVELVQQNVGTNARDRWKLVRDGAGKFLIDGKRPPAGWLRLPLRP
jgi:surface antigen